MSRYKSPAYWQQAITELSAADPVLGQIIASYAGERLQGKADAFHTLARSVTGQQISVKAADAIWNRLEAACGTVKPENLAALNEDALRALGFSRQKSLYLRDLSRFFLERKHLERDWAKMTDEEVIKDLVKIKGIGRWTAEMFLIFHLLRPDVFPVDDLGVLKAMRLHYPHFLDGAAGPNPNPRTMPCADGWSKADYLRLATTWKPWRSVATWYLWRSLDPLPVAY